MFVQIKDFYVQPDKIELLKIEATVPRRGNRTYHAELYTASHHVTVSDEYENKVEAVQACEIILSGIANDNILPIGTVSETDQEKDGVIADLQNKLDELTSYVGTLEDEMKKKDDAIAALKKASKKKPEK